MKYRLSLAEDQETNCIGLRITKWTDVMNDVQCGCLTYKYSLIAVILVPIICTLSMSLLVSLASTVPTTVNNRFRFSHDVLRRRSSASYSGIAKLLSANVPPWQHDRPSDRRNMDREQFVVLFVSLASPRTLSFNTLTTTSYGTLRVLKESRVITIHDYFILLRQ